MFIHYHKYIKCMHASFSNDRTESKRHELMKFYNSHFFVFCMHAQSERDTVCTMHQRTTKQTEDKHKLRIAMSHQHTDIQMLDHFPF